MKVNLILVVFVAVISTGCTSFSKRNVHNYEPMNTTADVLDADGKVVGQVPGKPVSVLTHSDTSYEVNLLNPRLVSAVFEQSVAADYRPGYGGGYHSGYSHVSGAGSYSFQGDHYPAQYFPVQGGTYSPTPMPGNYGNHGGGGRNRY